MGVWEPELTVDPLSPVFVSAGDRGSAVGVYIQSLLLLLLACAVALKLPCIDGGVCEICAVHCALWGVVCGAVVCAVWGGKSPS